MIHLVVVFDWAFWALSIWIAVDLNFCGDHHNSYPESVKYIHQLLVVDFFGGCIDEIC